MDAKNEQKRMVSMCIVIICEITNILLTIE